MEHVLDNICIEAENEVILRILDNRKIKLSDIYEIERIKTVDFKKYSDNYYSGIRTTIPGLLELNYLDCACFFISKSLVYKHGALLNIIKSLETTKNYIKLNTSSEIDKKPHSLLAIPGIDTEIVATVLDYEKYTQMVDSAAAPLPFCKWINNNIDEYTKRADYTKSILNMTKEQLIDTYYFTEKDCVAADKAFLSVYRDTRNTVVPFKIILDLVTKKLKTRREQRAYIEVIRRLLAKKENEAFNIEKDWYKVIK